MMDGLELGRIQVAVRAVGVARAALEDSLRYAQLRETLGSRSGGIRRSATGWPTWPPGWRPHAC